MLWFKVTTKLSVTHNKIEIWGGVSKYKINIWILIDGYLPDKYCQRKYIMIRKQSVNKACC